MTAKTISFYILVSLSMILSSCSGSEVKITVKESSSTPSVGITLAVVSPPVPGSSNSGTSPNSTVLLLGMLVLAGLFLIVAAGSRRRKAKSKKEKK